MLLLVLFIAIPLIEIGLFIQVGGIIGLWPTLAIVLLTAILGSYMVRAQGLAALGKLQNSFQTLQDPSEPLAHGAMILFAGALLLTPGFFTDAFGLALLVPAFRNFLMSILRKHMKKSQFAARAQFHAQNATIDADFVDVTPQDKPSGWTKD